MISIRWFEHKEDVMFLTDRKLERRIEEIEQYRYRDIIELKSFAAMEETQGVVDPKLPELKEHPRNGIRWRQGRHGREETVSCGFIRRSGSLPNGKAEGSWEYLISAIQAEAIIPALNQWHM